MMISLATPAFADGVNQFEIAEKNKQYNQDYYPPPSYYKKKHTHNNNNNDAWVAGVGGFIGGFILGNMGNGYEQPYVPPAYQIPGGAQEVCTTVWTMEPDGFGGWQRSPHTICGWQ